MAPQRLSAAGVLYHLLLVESCILPSSEYFPKEACVCVSGLSFPPILRRGKEYLILQLRGLLSLCPRQQPARVAVRRTFAALFWNKQ